MEHILAVSSDTSGSGVCSMKIQPKRPSTSCPVTSAMVRAEAKAAFDDIARLCETCDSAFWLFEKNLLVRMAVLGVCLMRLFLTARDERLDVKPFLEDDRYRPGDEYAQRSLKTVYGEVTYGRQY